MWSWQSRNTWGDPGQGGFDKDNTWFSVKDVNNDS